MLHNFVLSIDLYVTSKVYKAFPDNRGGPVTGLVSPVSSSLLSFLAEFPLGAGRLAMSTYLPRLLRSMREGAQGGAPSAIQTGAGGLTWMVQVPCLGTLLVFCVNQVIQPLFSTKFPTTLFLPNLSLYF